MVLRFLQITNNNTTVAIIELTQEKWKVFSKFFSKQNFGRPRKWSNRRILEAVLYVLQTGCQWRKLPKEYPPYQTVYRHFRQWQETEMFSLIRDTILQILKESGKKFDVGFVDATFVRAVCGGDEIGATKVGKGTKIMAIVDKDSRPLAAFATSANPHEITLLADIIDDLPEGISPKVLVGDKAYDSDIHDESLRKQGIELIAPHKQNRQKPKTQDGRKLKRMKKRWVVERFFGWMKPARRLLVRFDKNVRVFQAFLDIFSILTLIRHL